VNAFDLIRLALSRLGTSRLRAVLTMLGVIIGVGSIVALVAVAEGATSGITDRIQGLGTNLLTVSPGFSRSGFTRLALGSATTLTTEDAAAIAQVPGVAAVAPQLSASKVVVAGVQNETTTVIGTTPAYVDVLTYQMWQGSFLNQAAVDSSLRDAVIGATTADNLGLDGTSIGQTIQVGGIPFQLVGIMQPKGSTGTNQDDEVLIPITTAQHYFVGTDKVRTISVSVASADQIDAAQGDMTVLLEQRHGTNGTNDDFTITSQAQLLSTFSSITGLLTVLLGGIASISLIVGGIGIMNIMLVSVRERTREIGIRKAIGARRGDILGQFLVEAVLLSVMGGIIGVIAGLIVSRVKIVGVTPVVAPYSVALAFGVAIAVGLFFGLYPANRAAALRPIEALRHE